MDEQELAGFIIHDELAWRIWMNGCDIGLAHGHQDERAGMEELAELVARRQLVLEYCQDQIRGPTGQHAEHDRGPEGQESHPYWQLHQRAGSLGKGRP